MKLHRDRLRRLVPYALAGAPGAFLFRTAMQFDFQRRAETLGPDFWPQLVLVLLLVVCVCEILRIAFANHPDAAGGVLEDIAGGTGTATAEELPEPEPLHPWKLLAGMAATLGYVALVASTGFALTTAAYLAAFLYIGGYRRHRVIAALSVGGALLLMFIFMKLVYVSLPIGSGPFAQFTILLMKLMGIR
ncbi:MAG: tripartite tricarboxylate transporter TctB family protein [Burkholderiales bacterium]